MSQRIEFKNHYALLSNSNSAGVIYSTLIDMDFLMQITIFDMHHGENNVRTVSVEEARNQWDIDISHGCNHTDYIEFRPNELLIELADKETLTVCLEPPTIST